MKFIWNWQHCTGLQLHHRCVVFLDSYSLFESTHVICLNGEYTYVYRYECVCISCFRSVTHTIDKCISIESQNISFSFQFFSFFFQLFLVLVNDSLHIAWIYQMFTMNFDHFSESKMDFSFIFFSWISNQVIRADRSDKWTLQIKFPQLRDAGIYECQVNTEPKMSMAFRLNVVGECSFVASFSPLLLNGFHSHHFFLKRKNKIFSNHFR